MRVVFLIASLALGACGARTAPLTYTPTVTPTAGAGQVSVGPVADTRGRADPSFYGIVRGGVGQPIKTVQTNGPIAASVTKAFTDALAARGLLAVSAAPRLIRITMPQFDTNRYIRLESKVTLVAQVVDTNSGQVLAEIKKQTNKVSGSLFAFDTGVLASTDELGQQASLAMSEAIDQIVDDPAFRRAVAGAGAGRPGV